MIRKILTLTCRDRPGLVHDVSGVLLKHGGNIVENAQFGDIDTGLFCMRTEFDVPEVNSDGLSSSIENVLHKDQPVLVLRNVTDRPKVLIMVSKYDHCLADLLYRWKEGDLKVEIPLIVSNHRDCERLADWYGIPYVHMSVTKDNKAAQELNLLDLVEQHQIDVIVLARYMQVLSDNVCERMSGRIINIHHSFLPGFKGARPYHQAHARGVKLVGATAHFVTADLDEGPIIEQDVARVDHAYTTEHLTTLGSETERTVLSRAVKLWSENRVILIGHKTVVFR
jgi:formyltetrahydrofolate deformylase